MESYLAPRAARREARIARQRASSGNVFRPFYGARFTGRRLKYKLKRKEKRESRWKRPFLEKAAAPLIGDSGQRCDNK